MVKELSEWMEEFFNRRLTEDYPIMMLGGMAVGKMTVIAAMRIGCDGRKRILGLSSEVLKIRRPSRNCWKNGEQILRYAAAGFVEAEKSFRRIKSYQQIPLLLEALSRTLETPVQHRTKIA